MNHLFSQGATRGGTWNFLASVWPVILPGDSESQRRKKLTVRGAHLAVVAMVGASVAGAILAGFHKMSVAHVACLVVTALVYLLWSFHGTRDGVRFLLWEGGTPPPFPWPRNSRLNRASYFGIQLALAGLVCYLGDRGQATTLVWLVLLPPVAHAVILARWPGIAVVSALSMAILLFNVVRWHGWSMTPFAFLEFLFAVLFTVVFTLLAVNSERSRGEVQRLAAELSEANRKLRADAEQAGELAVARERNRLAREIHDSLGHYLTVINVQIAAARAVQGHDPDRARDALEKAQALTQKGLREIRHSVASLRGSQLDHKPLAEALRQVVEESRAAGLAAEMQVLGEMRILPPPVELTLYRAGQEGLTNTRKHAPAARVRLALDFRSATKVRLRVSDDGAGPAQPVESSSGFGLVGLRERVQLLGGEVRVQTSPGTGFLLEVEVPG